LRYILAAVLSLILASMLAVFAGCGDSATETTDDGGRKITVEESQNEGEGGTVTLEGEDGETSIDWEKQAPTEESLGVAIYPKAEYIPGSGVSSKTTSGEKENTLVGAEFTTTDDIKKVVSWYTAELGEPLTNTAEGARWGFQNENGELFEVKVEPFEGKVKIFIARFSGDVDINL
jgi:hypothetical protein